MPSPQDEPLLQDTAATNVRPSATLSWGNWVAIAVVCSLVLGLSVGVWLFRPKQPPTGRPIGVADGRTGKVQVFAVPARPFGEGFTIWRNGRQIGALSNEIAMTYQRVELSSNDLDIAGSPAPDLMLYAWTGGAHCCFTQILIDGQTGRLLGQFELGNSDPMPFLHGTAPNLAQPSSARASSARASSARAVGVNYDDVTAYQFGSYADSPMARIVVAWNGKRFGLDTQRMKAVGPDGPPAYFIAEPELGDALALSPQDFGESEDVLAAAPKLNLDTPTRGDRAKTYQTWVAGEEARMRATPLNMDDKTSFGPMAAFLNEQIYKGQASAGVATVMAAYEATPQVRDAALAYYFSVLAKSRWIDDLNKLNDGQLTAIITKQTTPLPTPAASP